MAKQPKSALDALERFILSKAPKHHIVNHEFDPAHLQDWARVHIVGIDSLPISALFSNRTIYSSPRINNAFRAWHDALHLHHGLDTSHDSEMEVARLHQRAFKMESGAPELGSFTRDAANILWADTAGQTSYFKIHGKFPDDQRAFVCAYLCNSSVALNNGEF